MAFTQEFQIRAELLHLFLAFRQRFLDGLRLATLRYIPDEVVEHLPLFLVFLLLPFGSPRRLGELLRHDLLHPAEHVGEAVRVRQPVLELAEDNFLDDRLSDDDPVVASVLGGPMAPVISAAFSGDLDDGGPANAAHHRAGEQFLRIDARDVPMSALETAAPFAAGPGVLDLPQPRLDPLPQFFGDDPEVRKFLHVPLALRFVIPPELAREGVTLIPVAVPGPDALVFLVPQHDVDCPRAPPAGLVIPPADPALVEALYDAEYGLSVREVPKNVPHYLCLGFIYLHQRTGWFFFPPVVEAHFLRRPGFKTERALPYEVPIVLSPLHSPQGLLTQVREKPFIDHALQRNEHLGSFVGSVDIVRRRHDDDPEGIEERDSVKRHEVASRKAGQVVYQNSLELSILRCRDERRQR